MIYLCFFLLIIIIYLSSKLVQHSAFHKRILNRLSEQSYDAQLAYADKETFNKPMFNKIIESYLQLNEDKLNTIKNLEISHNQIIQNETSRQVAILNIAKDLESKKNELQKEIKLRTSSEKEKDLLNIELRRSNQELDQFAYIASHDLRSPLRAIKQLGDWILTDKENKLSEESKDNLNLLMSRTKRLDNLLQALLQYSRAGELSQEVSLCNTTQITQDIFNGLHNPDNIKLNLINLPTIHAKKPPLIIVFQNILDNAIKHNNNPKGLITIDSLESKDFYQFNFRDNGPGIDEKYYGKVFEIFKTLESRDKIEASGMGLSIVSKIINSLEGKVWLKKPTEGPGVIVSIKWPKNIII